MSVIIQSAIFWADWPNSRDTTFEVRAKSSKAWISADSDVVPANESRVVGTGTITALRPTLPSITLPATSSGLDDQTARWTVTLHRVGSKNAVSTVLDNFPLPSTFEPSATWAQIKINKNGKQPLRDTSVYTKTETNTQIALAVGSLNDAGVVVKGRSRLSVAPVLASDPIAVGDNDPRIFGIASKIVIANNYAGPDVGAKINAADVALGSDEGIIYHFGGGTISTQVVVSSGHTLHLSGTYTMAIGASENASIFLKSNTTLEGDGWQTILKESVGPHDGNSRELIAVQDHASFFSGNGSTSQNIIVRDLQIQGNYAGGFNSTVAAVSMGNVHGLTIDNVYLNATHALGISVGAAASGGIDSLSLGRYAEDVIVSNCHFYKVASQNLSLVNGKNVIFANNTFRDPSQTGGPGVTVIDLEVNSAADDRMENIQIINNILDARNSQISPHGNFIAYQPGTTYSGPTRISGNIAFSDFHTSSGIILTSNAKDVEISNNILFSMGQSGIYAQGTRLSVFGNTLIDTGLGGIPALNVIGVTASDFKDNILKNPTAGTALISESGGATGNYYFNNTYTVIGLLSGSTNFGHPFTITWTAPTLLNSWVNQDASHAVGYQKINGIVYGRGVAINGSAVPTNIYTLPAGFRPAQDIILPVVSNGLFGYISIAGSTGVVRIEAGSVTGVSLSFSFIAEQ
jgi:hypothetical protein